MRIGITGAHGTGKTSLARALSQKLSLPLIAERARIVAEKLGIKSSEELLRDKNLAREFQVSVLLAQVGTEDAFLQGFVSDRTVLDCLAYWRLYGLCEEGEVGRTYVNQCLTRAYDILIYIPPEITADGDGFRLAGLQREADRLIRETICDTRRHPSVVIVVSGSLDDRVAAAATEIRRRGVLPGGPANYIAKHIGAQR
ncbi:MAG: ATP-binding protein [Peptococcaceae bacterium]|nr:ATP-binding protein [Peptococcaceae bacterium]